MKEKNARQAWTLVELMASLAIIGVLMSLLLPAVQAAREAARRTTCGNHLRQLGLACALYHDSARRLPSGFVWPDRTFWSALVLPYLEQTPVYDSLKFGASWSDPSQPNGRACQLAWPIFLCPSSAAPLVSDAQGVPSRACCTYLGNATGRIDRESGDGPRVADPGLDGVLFRNSGIRMGDVRDGTSHTALLGETLFNVDISAPDATGVPQIVDHWPLGTGENLILNEASEVLGSTAVAVNTLDDPGAWIDERELCFASRHPAGVQFVKVDGSVGRAHRSIDRRVWSAMGTRNGAETDTLP